MIFFITSIASASTCSTNRDPAPAANSRTFFRAAARALSKDTAVVDLPILASRQLNLKKPFPRAVIFTTAPPKDTISAVGCVSPITPLYTPNKARKSQKKPNLFKSTYPHLTHSTSSLLML
jgi:hypothetical protein